MGGASLEASDLDEVAFQAQPMRSGPRQVRRAPQDRPLDDVLGVTAMRKHQLAVGEKAQAAVIGERVVTGVDADRRDFPSATARRRVSFRELRRTGDF